MFFRSVLKKSLLSNSLTCISITDENIVKAINSLNANGSTGFDMISPKMIKRVSCYLVAPLRMMFAKSMTTVDIPQDWRKGIIVPIYKNNGKPSDAASYRPVCITSAISKIFEKIIHRQLLDYFIDHDIISREQHGFLQRRSTTTNLIECFNDWTRSMEEKNPIDIIYIDVAKAFDSVSPPKLLHKLSKLGIGGSLLHWVANIPTTT